ncbi:helix-turn-helix domain-containing protein [Pseudoalteromonas luteoviolacea]|uniref:HTH araC/xylS-type domain-containing protein n=1 Tax=Pseudoalteromonas luteoviolacea S4054 TaxID=1129367 RepID=A0A0F6A5K2_9GAMM|nr:AraC family transcriptional regulator [Pseudoalteromonas luteoviolacea]AOT07631.1 hypothetical protein S4054249_07150 [Pseudoalteromonas luteoviolacea]AOT12547.1 hypothetical protein S40542_07150 [Pseudoalteromonas luteoviolacea]AOT17461.1 hypothetical protein S4054_07150 [Pseudoalteromonas luteoviolacea]KKE81373.1 hypothetical protein N479_22835 [Pseudoalteromonas luteoviolacea S4054]KZN70618.1 hypothetical protein N481_20595 [Pseudoalteromonas luteoviolacea S4047-1]
MTPEHKAVLKTLRYNAQVVVGLRQFSAPFTYQDGLVNEARLIHIFKGQSSLICAGKTISLKPGDTLLMKADNFINRWLDSPQGNAVEFVGVRLTQSFIQSIYQNTLPQRFVGAHSNLNDSHCGSAAVLPKHTLLNGYFTLLKQYVSQPDDITETLIVLKIQELIELIMQVDVSDQITSLLSELFIPNQPKLQQVVQTHLYSPLKVEEMAFLCHMSTSTFNRKFKQVYGTSANKYLVIKRLEKAAQLINTTNDRVTDIALECGFEELSYFSRAFKQHFNVTPTELRKARSD